MGHFFNQRAFHPAPMAHDKVFNWNPVLRGEKSGLSDEQTLKAIGTGGYTVSGDLKSVQAQKAAEENQRNAAAEQQRVNQAIAALHAAYGIGDTGEAAANRGALDQQYAGYLNDYLAQGNDAATQGLDADQRAARFATASTGQAGGSVDAANQYGNLQSFLGRRSSVAAGGRANVDALRTRDQGEMLQGQSDIVGGTRGDEAIFNSLTAHQQQIGAARAAVPGDTVGQLAAYGGSLVSQNAQANGFYQGGGYGGGYPSYGMPGDSGYNPYYSPQARSPGLFGRSSGSTNTSIT